jgi:hypothetical protein
MRRSLFGSFLGILYLIIGVIVAANRHYFTHLSALKPIISALLAVLLWPLLLLGISLHIH